MHSNLRPGRASNQRMLLITGMSQIDALLRLDLNLLVSLQVLLEERSVTRAARRVGITQSAMSHRLDKLRGSFEDPLFVATATGLAPTPMLEGLAGELEEALQHLEVVLRRPTPFDARTAQRRFVVSGGDAIELAALPHVLRRLRDEAPGVQIASVPRGRHIADQLRRGDVHLAIAPGGGSVPGVEIAGPGLQQRQMAKEGFRVVVRHDHPVIGKRLTLKRYLEVGHVLVSPTGKSGGVVDAVLARRGLSRTVVAQVSHFISAPFLVAKTDLVLTCPAALAEAASEYAPLRTFAPPVPLPQTLIYGYWHGRFQHDPAHEWLRSFVASVIAEREPRQRSKRRDSSRARGR